MVYLQGTFPNITSTGTAYTSTIDTSSLIDTAYYRVGFTGVLANADNTTALFGGQVHLVNNTTVLFGKPSTRLSAGTWVSDDRIVLGSSIKNNVRIRVMKESWSSNVTFTDGYIIIHRVG